VDQDEGSPVDFGSTDGVASLHLAEGKDVLHRDVALTNEMRSHDETLGSHLDVQPRDGGIDEKLEEGFKVKERTLLVILDVFCLLDGVL